MHRHGYQGKKFGRERDQRQALIKGLAEALIIEESIVTTLPKAKTVARYTERLVTKAKKGDLHNRRQVISALNTLEAAHKLIDELSPKLSGRSSGYFRVVRTEVRRGDNAQMAKVSFVDDLKKKAEDKPAAKKKAEKTEQKAETDENPVEQKRTEVQSGSKINTAQASNQAARRTGRRGNR